MTIHTRGDGDLSSSIPRFQPLHILQVRMGMVLRLRVFCWCALLALWMTGSSPGAAAEGGSPNDNVAVQWNYLFWKITCRQSGAVIEPHILLPQMHLAQWHGLLALKNTRAGTRAEVVVAYASHKIMSNYFPFEQVGAIDPLLTTQLKNLRVSETEEKMGKQLGEGVALDLIAGRVTARQFALRALKKALDAEANAPRPGVYRYLNNTPAGRDAATFMFYEAALDQPYVVPEPVVFIKAFLSELKPPKVPSREWDEEYAKAKDVGRLGWPGRTREMNETTALLACPKVNSVSCYGPAAWNAIARTVLPNATSLYDTVTLFAKLAVAAHDSIIVLATLQFGFWFWRPVHAFRAGDPNHDPIPTWTPFVPTPPHAEYPSGTASSVSAAATILQRWFGEGVDVPFLLSMGGQNSPLCPIQDPVMDRRFKSFAELVGAYQHARVWAGAHWNISAMDGAKVGYEVAKYVDEHWTERPATGVLPNPNYMNVFAELPKKQTGWSPLQLVIPQD